MNFKQYITEMPIRDNSNLTLGNTGLNQYLFKNRLDSPAIKEINYKDMICRLVQTDAGISAICFNDVDYIGKIDCYEKQYFPFPNIDTSIVDKRYRGLGVAKFLYNLIIDQYGGIISGPELTDASFGIWKWLSKSKFIYILNLETGKLKEVKTLQSRHIKSKNELFVASSKVMDLNTLYRKP
jgi:hypothetical protein